MYLFKREFELKYSAWVNNVLLRRHWVLENPTDRHRQSPYLVIGTEYCLALCCPPYLDKTLSLKTSLTLDTGHRDINPELTRKLIPWKIVYIVPEGGMQVARREKIPVILPSAGSSMVLHGPNMVLLSRCAHWWNSGMKALGVTNHFLIGYESCSTGRISCLVV